MDPVVHFELPCNDRERITRFFGQVFGWTFQMYGPEMGNYVVVTTATADVSPKGQKGAINGGFFTRTPDMPAQFPGIVIGVKDIRASMRKVTDIPTVGAYVAFLDTEGNRSSMLQPLPTW
jgi:predicted enzyme related to lactoylglutathione lyase